MSAFAKEFLRDRFAEPVRPTGLLALFGKHPGWDDHVEDLLVATASLVMVKQLLYVQGIGGQVSSGGWARLAEGECLPAFDHSLLWRRGSQFIAGRLWSSTDGKRRAHFPMLALVHCSGLPLETSLGSILGWLGTVETACKTTRSADRVRSLFAQCQGDFQGWIDRLEPTPASEHEPKDWDVTPETLVPAVAAILSRARDFTPAKYKERSQLSSVHFRVPANGRDRAHDYLLWGRLLSRALHEDAPLLLIAPHDQPWLDLVVGEPAVSDLFPLRASEAALPIITDLAQVKDGERTSVEAEALVQTCMDPAATVLSSADEPQTRGWFSKLLGGRDEGG